MKNCRKLILQLFLIIFVFGCLIAVPRSIQASSTDGIINTMKQILDAVHMAAPTTSLPTSGEVESMRGAITCLAEGKEVEQCVSEHIVLIDNDYIDIVFDLYIAVSNEDFWAILGIVGDAAPCVIAEILSGGAGGGEICELLKELVEAVAKAAEAIAEFFSDVAGALSDLASSISCLFSDCSSGGPPPLPAEQVIYARFFEPMLQSGLEERKKCDRMHGDMAFFDFLRDLEETAYSAVVALLLERNLPYQHPDVWKIIYTVSNMYRENVSALWDSDMAQTLPVLAQKRNQYDRPESLTELKAPILGWANGKGQSTNMPYYSRPDPTLLWKLVEEMCYSEFTEFSHVDCWIASHPDQAEAGKLITNQQWCHVFAGKNAETLAEMINGIVPDQCPLLNQKYRCEALETYSVCVALRGLVGDDGSCSFNIPLVGSKVAKEIETYFKVNGSQIPCKIIVDDNDPGTDLPVRFVCSRPKQELACKTGQKYYNTVPVKLVQCEVREPEDYLMLKERVKEVVAILQEGGTVNQVGTTKPRPGFETLEECVPNMSIGAMGDPLIVEGPKCLMDKLKSASDQNMGFEPPSEKTGFEYTVIDSTFNTILSPYYKSVDGRSTPLFAAKPSFEGVSAGNKLKRPVAQIGRDQVAAEISAFDQGGHLDPITEGGPSKIDSPVENLKGSGVQKLRPEKPGSVDGSGQMVVAPVAGRQAGQQTEGLTRPMSGALPPGSAPGNSSSSTTSRLEDGKSQGQHLPTAGTTALSNISAEPKISIAGILVPWSGRISLNSAEARNSTDGLCFFSLQYKVRNDGSKPSQAFHSTWTNSLVPPPKERSWPSIAPNAVINQTETISLKSGQNILTLHLDSRQEIAESNETDNIDRITVVLNGDCGAVQSRPKSLSSPANNPRPGAVTPQRVPHGTEPTLIQPNNRSQ